MKKVIHVTVIAAFLFILSGIAAGQVRQVVKFARGSNSATFDGTIRGYKYHDFVFRASAGQTAKVKLASKGNPSVFNIFKVQGDTLDGALEVDDFTGTIPTTANYVIRVLMMRSEARRPGATSNYTLKISIR